MAAESALIAAMDAGVSARGKVAVGEVGEVGLPLFDAGFCLCGTRSSGSGTKAFCGAKQTAVIQH